MIASISDTDIAYFIGQYAWPFVRIGVFFLAVPVIGSRMISPRIRLVLAFFLTILVAPLLPTVPAVEIISLGGMVLLVKQVLVGLVMGFAFQIVMQVMVLSGQFIAMKMGLGFASMNDPSNGVSVTIVSQFFLMLSTLLFVTFDGHHLLIQYIVDSFYIMPMGETSMGREGFWFIVSMGSWMFNQAIMVALPLLTTLLIVNMAFGVMSRAAPQFNIFSLGFPVALLTGLFVIWLTMNSVLPLFQNLVNDGFLFLDKLMRL